MMQQIAIPIDLLYCVTCLLCNYHSNSYSLYGGAISTHGADISLHQLNEHEATKNKGVFSYLILICEDAP